MAGVEMCNDLPASLPLVWADRQSPLQILLNLARNSQRALSGAAVKQIVISAARREQRVVIRFCDTGPGVAVAENLFKPFQPGAEATGLGLYLSRVPSRVRRRSDS